MRTTGKPRTRRARRSSARASTSSPDLGSKRHRRYDCRSDEQELGVAGLQAAHDVVTESARADECGEGCAADDLDACGAHAGERDRKCERNDHAREALLRRHAEPASDVERRGRRRTNPEIDVDDDWRQGEQRELSDGPPHAHAQERGQQRKHGDARQRAPRRGRGQDRRARPAARGGQQPERAPDQAAQRERTQGEERVAQGVGEKRGPHGAGFYPSPGETMETMLSQADAALERLPLALDDPSLYFSRELSWLEFNDRVLEEALDAGNPLFERLKFVAIYGTNLDEFFMIRVAAIKQQIEAQVVRRSD